MRRLLDFIPIFAIVLLFLGYQPSTLPEDDLHIHPQYEKVAAYDDPTRADFQLTSVTFSYRDQEMTVNKPYDIEPEQINHLIKQDFGIEPKNKLNEIVLRLPNELTFNHAYHAIKVFLFPSAQSSQTFQFRLTNGSESIASFLPTTPLHRSKSVTSTFNFDDKLDMASNWEKAKQAILNEAKQNRSAIRLIISPKNNTTFGDILELHEDAKTITNEKDIFIGHSNTAFSVIAHYYESNPPAITKTVKTPTLKKGNPLSDPSEVEAAEIQPKDQSNTK